jgi:polar amino acid transport system substrate-binding protein
MTSRFVGGLRARRVTVLVAGATLALSMAACGNDGGGSSDTPAASGDTACASADTSAGDLLAKICEDGKITVSTDPAYPPQSSLDETTGEYVGFDIDVANEIAKRLGVDTAWQEPPWDAITAGSWNGRWDMSVGSMTVTKDRAKVLDFTPAYYYTPASLAVNSANTTAQDPTTDLDGKTIGTCSGCTYEAYLNGTLDIPGYTFDFQVDDPTVKGYDTDSTAIQDLTLGDGTRLDAVMSATPTLQGAIDKGKPIRLVGDPLFYEPLAAAFDKSSSLDDAALLAAVSKIIEDMHADGTLTDLSMKWYGEDLTKAGPDSSSSSGS